MLVDTNILIYAINSHAAQHVMARDFLRKEFSRLVIAHQNILETLRVLTHPTFPSPVSQEDAINIADHVVRSFHVISPTQETFILFWSLLKKYPHVSNRIFDVYLIATALSNGVRVIATDNDRDFRIFTEITVVNPFARLNN